MATLLFLSKRQALSSRRALPKFGRRRGPQFDASMTWIKLARRSLPDDCGIRDFSYIGNGFAGEGGRRAGFTGWSLIWMQRQNELDGGPVSYIGHSPDATPVKFDDRTADRESHAHAAGFGSVKCIE
jgi:hypothetical protein